jgi:hypothetical protein
MGLDFGMFNKSNWFGDGLFTIQSVYCVGLGLGSLNLFQNSFIMMFTLDPPSNRTSSTIFLST